MVRVGVPLTVCGWIVTGAKGSVGAGRCGSVRVGAGRCGSVRVGAGRCGSVRVGGQNEAGALRAPGRRTMDAKKPRRQNRRGSG